MKKAIARLLIAAILIVICLPVQAEAAQFRSTQALLAALNEAEIAYTIGGLDDDGDERVRIPYRDANNFEYTIHLFFDDNEENCYLRVWNIINYAEVDFSKILRVCNSLNNKYNYVCFNADETDNTVTATMDTIYRDNDVGEIVLEAVQHMMSIIEKSYPSLEVYDQ